MQAYTSYQEWFNKVWILANPPFRFRPFDIFSAEQLVDMYSKGISPKTVAKKMQIGMGIRHSTRLSSTATDKIIKDLKDLSKKPSITDFNSSLVRTKFKSELVRILYYIAIGMQGPHPWGIASRPQPPERLPLQVKDKTAGKYTRETLEKFINNPRWDSWIRQLLKEAKKELSVK